MHISLEKLKAILLYFCEHTNPRYLGKTKLMKLFFFLDFGSVKKYGVPITYDQYFKLEHGPIPTVIKNMVDEVDCCKGDALLSDTIEIKTGNGGTMHRVIPQRKLEKNDLEMFSKNELHLLKKICRTFNDYNTEKIEKASHDGVWNCVRMTEAIPYELAAKEKDCHVPERMIRLALDIHYGRHRTHKC